MSDKSFSSPNNTVAICSAMSFLVCLVLRILIIVISGTHIVVNFEADELGLPNTKELVDELDKSDSELLEDISGINDDNSNEREPSLDPSNLRIPRKRKREAILEVDSYHELSYVIEKYRCVAVLYQDSSEVIASLSILKSKYFVIVSDRSVCYALLLHNKFHFLEKYQSSA